MKNQTKQWCLYTDKEQTQLLACAYEEAQIDFESQYYSEGCWFEYDVEITERKTAFLVNEKEYKKKVRFPKEPIERPKYGEEDYNTAWSKMKESMKKNQDLRKTEMAI